MNKDQRELLRYVIVHYLTMAIHETKEEMKGREGPNGMIGDFPCAWELASMAMGRMKQLGIVDFEEEAGTGGKV